MESIKPTAVPNDPRFIDDDQAPAELKPICDRCPLYDLCAKYADIERPKGGIWAGKRFTQYKTKKNS